MPEIYNKSGKLSKYGFACGYIEVSINKVNKKQIYFEHNTFHVRSGKVGEFTKVWETFMPDELTKARKFYNSIKI